MNMPPHPNVLVRVLARLLRPIVIEILHKDNIDPAQVRRIREGILGIDNDPASGVGRRRQQMIVDPDA